MPSLFSMRLDQSIATVHDTNHATQSAQIVYSGVIEIPHTRARTRPWRGLPSPRGRVRAGGQRSVLVVRGFGGHLSTIDPATEIPPADLLRWRARLATPYLYTSRFTA